MSAIADEVVWPSQGAPRPPAGAQWAQLPDIYAIPEPLPLTSQMLARLPPQALPPGPMPMMASDLLSDWAIRLILATNDAIQMREAHFFSENPPPKEATEAQLKEWLASAPTPAPKDLILGDGAFRMIPTRS